MKMESWLILSACYWTQRISQIYCYFKRIVTCEIWFILTSDRLFFVVIRDFWKLYRFNTCFMRSNLLTMNISFFVRSLVSFYHTKGSFHSSACYKKHQQIWFRFFSFFGADARSFIYTLKIFIAIPAINLGLWHRMWKKCTPNLCSHTL